MTHAPRLRSLLACLAAPAALAGCLTPQAVVHESQAVVDARAHRDAPPAPACPQTALAEMSPLMLGFAFDEAVQTPPMGKPLADAARWLACHPATQVVIKPDSDGHGTEAQQDQLARNRADVARNYLTAHGVAPARIQVLARGAAAPSSGEVFLIQAEGRRW
jgi:outer membrane protein OmpA-like peptidoglycan-associated protein